MPVVAAPERRLGRAAGAPGRRGSVAALRPGLYATIFLVCAAVAAASLPLASGPAYDPWAWIVWGREVLHLGLLTTGGPTWKPLPVMFTTVFAVFGSAAPDLWLLTARAGGMMAVALAALLAWRLAGEQRGGRGRVGLAGWARAAAAVSAALAAIGLLILYQFAAGVATGGSEGLLAALTLLAILRHLDGEPRQALALGFLAALLRPETWPFLALYGAWLWRRDAGARTMIAAVFGLVAVLWFVPELVGSGSLVRGVQWARYPREGSPALARCPFCSEISASAWPLLTMPFKVGLALALGSAALMRPRRALLGVVSLGLAWVVEEAVLTQMGFSGSDRYLTAPLALLIVAGAAGWGRLLVAPRPVAAVAGIAVALSLVSFGRGPHFGSQAASVRDQASIRRDMGAAVALAGGRGRLLACGAVETNPSEAPLAAWTLGVPLARTESSSGDVIIRSGGASSAAPAPGVPAGAGFRQAADTTAVKIFTRCR